MKIARTLATKLVVTGAVFLLLAVASTGVTMWVGWQLEGGAAAVNEAGRLRMQTWRLAAHLSAGRADDARALAQRFDDSLALLHQGDASRPLALPADADVRSRLQGVEQAWQALQAQWLAPAAGTVDPPALARDAAAFVERVDGLVGAIEHALSAWAAILSLSQMAMVVLAIASALALLYAGHVFVLSPLDQLQGALQRVQAGDWSARVAVAAGDEFGTLAAGFNRMAATLQELYRNLEFKVREKTAHLASERERLERLYGISEFLAGSASLPEMAQGFVRRVRTIAGADAAAIRWSDEGNQRYVLLAGDCLPQALAEDETCLRTGECLCGQPAQQASTRVIPIRGGSDRLHGHCTRAGYRTLVSIPVLLQQRVLGEVDLFFHDAVTLPDAERQHLEALAAHLASAMEGLRAEALGRESAVAEERTMLARELHDSIAQSLSFLKIQVGLLRGAIRRRDDAAAARALDELDAGVRESTADVRELLLHFRTRTNGEDIVPALRSTLQKFEHQTGLATTLTVDGDGLPLAPDVQVQVLHVVQEALSNVRKHARASTVRVDVRQAAPWRVVVRDDGEGFDGEHAAPDETHVGLRIMRERAARIGADVSIDAAPGRGTRVTLTVPGQAPAVAA